MYCEQAKYRSEWASDPGCSSGVAEEKVECVVPDAVCFESIYVIKLKDWGKSVCYQLLNIFKNTLLLGILAAPIIIIGYFTYPNNPRLLVKGVVNCQNSRDKGPPEGNGARG